MAYQNTFKRYELKYLLSVEQKQRIVSLMGHITGGYTVVEGPTNSGNGPLDYDRNGTISGGTILISGSSGMAQSLTATGEQGVLAINVGSCNAGTLVEFADAEGNTILTLQPEKAFGCVIVSSPDIQRGQTYTVTLGTQSAEFEA